MPGGGSLGLPGDAVASAPTGALLGGLGGRRGPEPERVALIRERGPHDPVPRRLDDASPVRVGHATPRIHTARALHGLLAVLPLGALHPHPSFTPSASGATVTGSCGDGGSSGAGSSGPGSATGSAASTDGSPSSSRFS